MKVHGSVTAATIEMRNSASSELVTENTTVKATKLSFESAKI